MPGAEADRRASAGRRSPRRARRSGRRRRSSTVPSRRARRTRRSCACSSRGRGRASARACTARRRRRGARGPSAKCARQSSQSDSPIFGASASAARTRGLFTSKTRSGFVARFARASSSSTSACASSHAVSRSTYAGRQARRRSSSAAARTRDPDPAGELRVELDHLGVDGGIARADRLDRALPVLAVPPLLRARRSGTSARSCRASPAAARGACRARGRRARSAPSLRAQRQRAVASVVERVHLLLDDVGARAGRCAGRAPCPRSSGVWMRR